MKKTLTIILLVFALAQVGWADEIDDIIPFVIMAESSGNPDALSKAGGVGLMQITPIVLKEWNRYNYPMGVVVSRSNAKRLGLEVYDNIGDLFNPSLNVEVGEWYLRRLQTHYLKPAIKTIFVMYDRAIEINPLVVSINPEHGVMHEVYPLKDFPNIQTEEDYMLALVLGMYNWGLGNVRKVNYDINRFPKVTQKYIKGIMKAYKKGE